MITDSLCSVVIIQWCWNMLVDQLELLSYFASFAFVCFELAFLQTDMDFQVSWVDKMSSKISNFSSFKNRKGQQKEFFSTDTKQK